MINQEELLAVVDLMLSLDKEEVSVVEIVPLHQQLECLLLEVNILPSAKLCLNNSSNNKANLSQQVKIAQVDLKLSKDQERK